MWLRICQHVWTAGSLLGSLQMTCSTNLWSQSTALHGVRPQFYLVQYYQHFLTAALSGFSKDHSQPCLEINEISTRDFTCEICAISVSSTEFHWGNSTSMENASAKDPQRLTCTCPCGCMNPPITPKEHKSSPESALVARAGIMVWYGRFLGARQFGWSGCSEKLAPLFWKQANAIYNQGL